jgi:hypothetical protein
MARFAEHVVVLYTMPVPYGDGVVEVYGDSDMGSYEYRVVVAGKVTYDTVSAGYGNPSIAMRDALVRLS